MEYGFVTGFIGYLVALGALGAWFYKKSASTHDYSLGGRSLGYWTTAIAAHASDMSIWMFMGLPAAAYTTGMKSIWIPLGLVTGMFITWKIIAQPLRLATEKYKSETLSTFFEKRFEDTAGHVRLLSAFFSLWFFTFYISSGLVGMGYLFESALHVDYHYGIVLGLLIIISYTFLGGFAGIAQSHLFQGIFLITMMVLVPALVFFSLPTGSSLSELAATHGISLSFIPSHFSALIGSLILAISWGMGYFGQPHILVNFMGIKDPEAVPKAMRIGMIWQLFTQGASVIIGLLGIAYFVTPLADAQLVLITMVQTIFPAVFAGAILCAIVAAGLTTIATQTLVATATITNDLYKNFINPTASTKKLRSISHYALVSIPLLSFAIAFTKDSTVYSLVEYAWNGLGATFGPAVIAALYLPRATAKGIMYGMIAAGTIVSNAPLSLLWLYPANFTTLDYFPLLPWFGLMALGIYCGNLWAGRKAVAPARSARGICFLGRHSLAIYVIHQPILIVILFASGIHIPIIV